MHIGDGCVTEAIVADRDGCVTEVIVADMVILDLLELSARLRWPRFWRSGTDYECFLGGYRS